MKKILLVAAILFVIVGCLPFTSAPNPAQNVDVAGTSGANVQTAVVQTLIAQPTATLIPPSNTAEGSFATPGLLTTDTPSASPTMTVSAVTDVAAITDTVSTGTFEVATSTNISATLPTSGPPGAATVTPTLGVLTFGTLPPAVPFSSITLINRSKRQAYISLQVVTAQGGPTVIEYPVRGKVKIKAPLGSYLYVAWVGGREMVGEFKLRKDQELSIILYKDRVEIQ